jgi:hypothetical protein
MKTQLCYLLALTLAFVSCSKDDDDDLIRNPSPVLSSGTWRVTEFIVSGNNETADFTGYTFTFNSNGTVTAVKAAINRDGSWSYGSNSVRFYIDFGPPVDVIGELTDDWKLISVADTQVRLSDDNSGNNASLVFTKN